MDLLERRSHVSWSRSRRKTRGGRRATNGFGGDLSRSDGRRGHITRQTRSAVIVRKKKYSESLTTKKAANICPEVTKGSR